MVVKRSYTLAAVVAFSATLTVAAAPARADEPLPQRTTGLVVKDGQLLISVGLGDLFGPAERQRLTSGFSTRVLIRLALPSQPEKCRFPIPQRLPRV